MALLDERDWKDLEETIINMNAAEGTPEWTTKHILGRLVSHLKSEERPQAETVKMVNIHEFVLFGDKSDQKRKPGLLHEVTVIEKKSWWIEKVTWAIFVTIVLKWLWEVATGHKI